VVPTFRWRDQHHVACRPENHASTAAGAATVHEAQWQAEELCEPVKHERLELGGGRGGLPHVNPTVFITEAMSSLAMAVALFVSGKNAKK
jgi:hypothetical protein